MIAGWFRDAVDDPAGGPRSEGGWQPNLIVATAWPLVVALLRRDPEVAGITHCALGSGDPAWDEAPPQPSSAVTHLRAEVTRVPLGPEDFTYLDATGQRVPWPTTRLEVRVNLPITRPLTLREFGLVGGDRAAPPGGGSLVDYVVHPRVELRPGQTLTRRVALHFGGAGAAAPVNVPVLSGHLLGQRPVTEVVGVGPTLAAALKRGGVKTIDDLARLPRGAPLKIAPARLMELQAKARLALRAAARLPPVAALAGRGLAELAVAPPAALATEAGISPETGERLQEQLALLHVALASRALRRMTLGDLGET